MTVDQISRSLVIQGNLVLTEFLEIRIIEDPKQSCPNVFGGFVKHIKIHFAKKKWSKTAIKIRENG